MAPPVRSDTPNLISLPLSLGTEHMGIYHKLVSTTQTHAYITQLITRHISSPQIVVHSVLASRILFNLRESEGRSRTDNTSTWKELTDIQFGGDQHSAVRSEV
jgi:hypothetical protein